jgi:hypothetical protein
MLTEENVEKSVLDDDTFALVIRRFAQETGVSEPSKLSTAILKPAEDSNSTTFVTN